MQDIKPILINRSASDISKIYALVYQDNMFKPSLAILTETGEYKILASYDTLSQGLKAFKDKTVGDNLGGK